MTLALAIFITVGIGLILAHALGIVVHKPPGHVAMGVFVSLFVLWTFSRFMARRIAHPFVAIEQTLRKIGSGDMQARIDMHDRHMRMGEMPVLAHTINEMAGRLDKQLSDQRALLATVSHEIRTPLARMRLLVEFARDNVDEKKRGVQLDELDKEIVGVDALVSELLAASRIDFGALRRTELIAYDVCKPALERRGTFAGGDRSTITPTVQRSWAMQRSSRARWEIFSRTRSVTQAARSACALWSSADRISSIRSRRRAAQDFHQAKSFQVFEPFYRGKNGNGNGDSVGLGLSLVKRIAEAHGGRAYAHNREGGGARVGIELARA